MTMTMTMTLTGTLGRVADPVRRALLDTSVVIDFDVELLAPVAEEFAVSTISLAELAFGLHTVDPLVNAAREERYAWVLATFAPLTYTPYAARVFGALCAAVRDAGRDPRPRRFDLLIASVAVSAALPLVTRNPRDFTGIPSLQVVPLG